MRGRFLHPLVYALKVCESHLTLWPCVNEVCANGVCAGYARRNKGRMAMKAIIIGAGIGGLSAAIALSLKGWSVQLFEQSKTLTEVGAGLQLSPNGTKVLDAMGVLPKITEQAFEPKDIELRIGASGRSLFRLPKRQAAIDRWGAAYINIHRADLQTALIERARALGAQIMLGATYVSSSNGADSITAQFADGSRATGTVLIGADGLNSVFRQQIIGPDQPRFTGQVAWRCTVPLTDVALAPPENVCAWAGQGRHAVTTRIRGGQVVNFVGVVETDTPDAEGWDTGDSKTALKSDFKGFHDIIQGIIAAARTPQKWALFDRAPLATWSKGRAVILGDAAHPMLPSMAQGAVQAIEDAWVLARCLETAPVPTALSRFYDSRIARVSKLQKMSATNARLFHQAGGLKGPVFYGAMAVLGRVAPQRLQARQDWVYGHDVTG